MMMKEKMIKKTIGVWCEHNFQIYSALPIINKYIVNNSVIVFTNRENVKVINELVNHPNFQVKCIQNFTFKPATLFKKIFEILFVSENFSFVYKHEFVNKESLKIRILRKVFFLKLPNDKVNKSFLKLNNLFFKNKSIEKYFDLNLMITFTKVYYAHLIPSKDRVPHINIMESWDHPMKFPYYLFPNYSLTWNKDLAKDTKRVQHLLKVKQITPLKFKYLYECNNIDIDKLLNDIKNTTYYEEIMNLQNKKVILYPTTTSSANIMHQGEMKLIKELCEVFEGTLYYLYIKPKPNAPNGDYDIFKSYKNVIIGIYADSALGSDILDSNYNIFRYLLLKYSNIVINAGTTFALEAAIVDKNIIQLNLEEGNYFGFAKWCKTYHLSKYVLSLNGVFQFKGNNKTQLLKQVEEPNPIFCKELKKWITEW